MCSRSATLTAGAACRSALDQRMIPLSSTMAACTMNEMYARMHMVSRRLHEAVVVGRPALVRLDDSPQVEQRLVDLSDRAKDVLLKQHREIVGCALGLAAVIAGAFGVFHEDARPQHDDDRLVRLLVINAVARTVMDAHFAYAFADGFGVAGIAKA